MIWSDKKSLQRKKYITLGHPKILDKISTVEAFVSDLTCPAQCQSPCARRTWTSHWTWQSCAHPDWPRECSVPWAVQCMNTRCHRLWSPGRDIQRSGSESGIHCPCAPVWKSLEDKEVSMKKKSKLFLRASSGALKLLYISTLQYIFASLPLELEKNRWMKTIVPR